MYQLAAREPEYDVKIQLPPKKTARVSAPYTCPRPEVSDPVVQAVGFVVVQVSCPQVHSVPVA